MAEASTATVRITGAILLVVAAFLAGMGVWLAYFALSWDFPSWVPSDITSEPQGPALAIAALGDAPIGLAALYVLAFSLAAGLNGL